MSSGRSTAGTSIQQADLQRSVNFVKGETLPGAAAAPEESRVFPEPTLPLSSTSPTAATSSPAASPSRWRPVVKQPAQQETVERPPLAVIAGRHEVTNDDIAAAEKADREAEENSDPGMNLATSQAIAEINRGMTSQSLELNTLGGKP